MNNETSVLGVPVSLTLMNILLTTGVVLIANGRLAAVAVFIPMQVGLRWLCSRETNCPQSTTKEIQ